MAKSQVEYQVVYGAKAKAWFVRRGPRRGTLVAVGEETGRMSDLLKDTAEFYEESVERQTKDMSTIIEPFLMIIIGAGVGFFALSMIAPIYSLSNAI